MWQRTRYLIYIYMCNNVKHFLISTLISTERILMIFNKKWQWLKWFRLLLKFNSLLQVYTYVLCAVETCVSVLMWSFQYCLESKLKYVFHVHNHHLCMMKPWKMYYQLHMEVVNTFCTLYIYIYSYMSCILFFLSRTSSFLTKNT